MIRSLLMSVWIVAVTLAAVYFGHAMKGSPPQPGAEHASKASPTTIKLKSFTVPVVTGGTLQGHVMTQVSISANSDLVKNFDNRRSFS